jgi:hypothetical protein
VHDLVLRKYLLEPIHFTMELPADGLASALLAEVNAWSMINGSRGQSDDITIVVLGVN